MRRHSEARAKERYNIKINANEVKNIIRRGQAQFLRRQENGRTLWNVNYHGTPMLVVYSPYFKMPVTILPPDYFEQPGRVHPELDEVDSLV